MKNSLAWFMTVLLVSVVSCGDGKNDENGPSSKPTSQPVEELSQHNVTVIGLNEGGFSDSPVAKFNKPIRLAPFGAETVLVADIKNHAIRRVTKQGKVTTFLGGPHLAGHKDGLKEVARFKSPHGVTITPDGTVVVSEAENHTIRLADPGLSSTGDTVWQTMTLCGEPGQAGDTMTSISDAKFSSPHAAVWNEKLGVVVCDIGNKRLCALRGKSAKVIAGAGSKVGGDFMYPMDVACATDGTIYLADAGLHCIFKIPLNGAPEKIKVDRELKTPHGVAFDEATGAILVAELRGHRITKIDPATGKATTVMGNGVAGNLPNQLNQPAALLIHGKSLWIADLGNHQVKIIDWSKP